jgi:hypothetical protein
MRVQVKLEVAKFLQDCVEEKAVKLKKSTDSKEKQMQAKELYALIAKVHIHLPRDLHQIRLLTGLKRCERTWHIGSGWVKRFTIVGPRFHITPRVYCMRYAHQTADMGIPSALRFITVRW